MQDIRLVGNDGEYLNLETQTGEQFRLVLDDTVRAAVKRENTAPLDQISITPREIQDAVRAGATPEEVSEEFSVPFDYVDKFAQTVVDEIGHIIASAQSVRLTIAADRYSEATQVEFREVVQARLHNAGSKISHWSALKTENSPWNVRVHFFDADGNEKTATWAFDPRRLVLSPENESAVNLTNSGVSRDIDQPKLRVLDEVISQGGNARTADDLSATQAITVIDDEVVSAAVATSSAIEELTKSSLQVVDNENALDHSSESTEAPEPAPISATVDLLEALRRKRAAADSVAKPPANLEQPEPEAPEPITSKADQTDVKGDEAIPAAKKGRPSMPSWDEIVFGTKTDE